MIYLYRIVLAISLLFGVISPGWAAGDFAAVKAAYRSSEALLLDRQGRVLQQLRLDEQARRLDWVELDQVAPVMLRLLVASEDRNFYQHRGVDWSAMLAAAWGNLWSSRSRGASTLTMQLAGLLEDGGQRQGRRSLWEKAAQVNQALDLEQGWSKAQILEAYLNLASFRGELQGIEAMSRGLFGKAPLGLDAWESALAVALLRAPGASPAQVAARACALLRLQDQPEAGSEVSDCEGIQALASRVLRAPYRALAGGDAPHLARRLLTAPGERFLSSLDGDLQRYARQSLHQQLSALRGQFATDGAVLVLDNASGEVLAWVGSSGQLSGAAQVDGVVALRQAGSTLKPFLYGLAIAERRLTAASLLEDTPVQIATPGGLYVPQNYDKGFKGTVSLRMALGSSLNVPAVRVLVQTGTDPFLELLRRLGFDSLTESGDYYGYSLALGSADVSLLALTNAYRALAAGGDWSPVRFSPGPAQPGRPALSAAAAFIVADMLADRSARIHTFGLDSLLSTPYWSAVKTGTSKDMRDNWCVGFSHRYTVGVWVGNAQGLPMHDVSGISGAAPVWRAVLDFLERGLPAERPGPPAGVERLRVSFEPPLEPARDEWFLAGTGRTQIMAAPVRRDEAGRIAYPAQGTVIALDPDIPVERQQVRFRAKGVEAGRWRLDGKPVAGRWLPAPGSHRLELVDGGGRVVDQVDFQVRGISFRLAPPAGPGRGPVVNSPTP